MSNHYKSYGLDFGSTDEIVLDTLRKYYKRLDLLWNDKPKEPNMTEVTVTVDRDNPGTVTVNGEVCERKVPVLTLEQRVIAELDEKSMRSRDIEDCLYSIGIFLASFHQYDNPRKDMGYICLYARQILKTKGVEVKSIGDVRSAHTQNALPLYIALDLAEYHYQPNATRIENIYYSSLRWLMNDLESNSK